MGSHTRVVHFEVILDLGSISSTKGWKQVREDIVSAVQTMQWPPGSGSFTLYEESGKGRGKGSGVTPIKLLFLSELKSWSLESKPERVRRRPERRTTKSRSHGLGPLDATKVTADGTF